MWLLAAALALQLYAIQPYWAAERRLARTTMPAAAPLPTAELEGASQLLVAQGPAGETHGLYSMRHAQQLALDSGVPLAGGRFPRRPIADEEERFEALQAAGDFSVRYVAPADADASVLPERLPWVPTPVACTRWEAVLVCRPQKMDAHGAAAKPSHRIPLRPVSSFVD